MNKIYLITGPAGVGKSTVSNLLAESLTKSVLIEGDTIYHLVVGGYVAPWQNGNHLKFFFKNVISLIKNSLEEGYDVVYNHIITEDQVELIKQTFKSAQIKFVCLMVDEQTIVSRDKLRPLDCQMGERSLVLLNEFKNEKYVQKYILNSSNLTAEQTYKKIVSDDKFNL